MPEGRSQAESPTKDIAEDILPEVSSIMVMVVLPPSAALYISKSPIFLPATSACATGSAIIAAIATTRYLKGNPTLPLIGDTSLSRFMTSILYKISQMLIN